VADIAVNFWQSSN